MINNSTVNEFRASYSRFITASLLDGIAATYPECGDHRRTGSPDRRAQQLPAGPHHEPVPAGRTVQQDLADGIPSRPGRKYRWYTGLSNFLQNSRGIYYYSNIANLLMDQVPANDQLQGIGSGAVSLNARNMALFVQDDFKLTPRLTINAGLRYEYFGNPAGAANQERNSVSDLPGTPLVFHTPNTDKNNFAPASRLRLGYARQRQVGSARRFRRRL